MKQPFTVMSVFGTRPEAVKMAPLVKRLQADPDLTAPLCVTGQHRHMLDGMLRFFGLHAERDLNIMTPRQTLADIAARTLTGMDTVFERQKPDLVLVHGDTSAALLTALCAYYHQIPVGHVEAGLRTRNTYAPFPEEVNRQMIARIARLHFCPTAENRENLLSESVGGEIFVTGNTVIDAMAETVRADYVFEEPALHSLDFQQERVLVCTAHRRENLGQPLEQIAMALRRIARERPDIWIVYPLHPNPAVRGTVLPVLESEERVLLLGQLGLLDMHNLMARSCLVLTDSGGLQEEAPALGKPVLVMREKTERPEAVRAGTVRMVGTETDDIVNETLRLLDSAEAYAQMARAVNPYGDGQASRRIHHEIRRYAGFSGDPPPPFLGDGSDRM